MHADAGDVPAPDAKKGKDKGKGQGALAKKQKTAQQHAAEKVCGLALPSVGCSRSEST